MLLWLFSLLAFADFRMLIEQSSDNSKLQVSTHIGKQGFIAKNNQTKVDFIARFIDDYILIVNHSKKMTQKIRLKDLMMKLNKNKDKQSALAKSDSYMLDAILQDMKIDGGKSFAFEKIKIIKAKSSSENKMQFKFQDEQRQFASLTTRPFKAYKLSKADQRDLKKTFKSLILFEAAQGRADAKSLEYLYYKILQQQPSMFYAAEVFGLDPRYSKKTKLLRVQKIPLKASALKAPKYYKTELLQ